MAESAPNLSEELILARLKEVIDPEVGLNIVDMGLIYKIDITGGRVVVNMTLTSQGCPMGDYITGWARQVLENTEAVTQTDINLVWDPPWTPEKINKDELQRRGI